jgi:hypothetical protein
MAHSLDGAHSILMLRASRTRKGVSQSNIRWSYAAATVPRHHRDIYVTEYGIAATRGKTDMQVIDAMLQIAGSAFQPALVAQAKGARKLAADYSLPNDAADNSPRALYDVFERPELKGCFPRYPLGTVLTNEEQQLIPALEWLQSNTASAPAKLRVLFGAMLTSRLPENRGAIDRLGLTQPAGVGECLRRRLVRYALTRTEE